MSQYFNSPPNLPKTTPSIQYVFDSGFAYNGITGIYRPVSSQDLVYQKIADDFGYSGCIGSGVNSYYEYDNIYGFSSLGFYLNVPSGGKVSFEGTFDGSNWSATTLRQLGDDGYTTSTNISEDYIGSISTLRKFRVKTIIAGSGNGTIIGRASSQVNTLEGIENRAAPHKIGYRVVHKDFDYPSQVTSGVIWTPENGHRFVVTDLVFSAAGSINTRVTFFDGFNISGSKVCQMAVQPPTNSVSFYSMNLQSPYVSTGLNSVLKVTTTAEVTLVGVVHGYEIPE